MPYAFEGKKTDRGSKAFTVVAGAVLLGTIAIGYRFWSDREGLVRHVRDRDQLAVLSVWVMLRQGVDAQKARQPLLDALEQGQPSLRSAAVKALGTLKDGDLIPEIGKAATRDASPAVRLSGLEALEQIGRTSAQPFVRTALDDPDLTVQGAACRCAGGLELHDMIPLIIEKLGSSDNKLRIDAQAGLECFLKPGETSRGAEPGEWSRFFASRR
jgi:hypothetical protein